MTSMDTLDYMAANSSESEGHGEYFGGLMGIIGNGELSQALGQRIIDYTKDYVAEHPLTDVGVYDPESYHRNYIGKDAESGWEAIIMSWHCGNSTSIHSHPQYAGYTFADGDFLVEIFEYAGDGTARKIKEMRIAGGIESYFAIGEPGCFDNHIHRITCLSDTGHSLHVYSDNALQGLIYREAAE